MTKREQVEQEAEERFPLSFIERTSIQYDGSRFPCPTDYNRIGFIEGRTVYVGSAHWTAAVNEADAYLGGLDYWEPDDRRDCAAGITWNILTAAGFIVTEAA